ncbi:MAG: hypothetical protein KatS3mg109_0827 [Pirellulaceae bacterium]|nr:MAG: hypothetical protein KatS3mg109_0827 [Pirellulaceae bacterium]
MKTATRYLTAARRHAVVRILGLLVSLLALPAAPGTSNGAAPRGLVAAPASPTQGEQVFYVDWNITASGSETQVNGVVKVTEKEQIVMRGSAVVHKKPYGGGSFVLETIPFELTVTDDWEQILTSPCYYQRVRRSITDPARYMGGPDQFWAGVWSPDVGLFQPRQRADGSWYMEDPFNPWFYVSGPLIRYFTYRDDALATQTCEGVSFSHTDVSEGSGYVAVLSESRVLEGDPTGTVFTRDETYTTLADPPLTVNFHGTVRLPCGPTAAAASTAGGQGPNQQVCGCAAYPPSHVFDVSDPIVTSLEVWASPPPPLLLHPDSEADIYFVATCEGRRVKNAELEVTVKPVESSGGHLHDGNRPRGYLNGTEITEARPSIKVQTDDRGNATVRFMAGKDLQARIRGIAGIYVVKARSTRFPYGQRSQTGESIPVLVWGLQELGPGANYQLHPAASSHPNPFYGTPATLNAVRQLADAFRQRQEEHNADLRFYGKLPWPIAPTTVYAISMEDGGLFDLPQRGWWRPPFGLHEYGWQVTLLPTLTGLEFPVPKKEVTAWMEREFRRLGEQYGTWYPDGGSPWNLAVEQGAARQATLASTAEGPNLATVVFLSDPADRYVAGAGQTVTYTVGVENLTRGTQAHNAVLTATLPTGLTFVRAVPAATRMAGPNQPVWDLGTLNAEGVPRLFDVVAQVGAGVAPGTVLTVTAQASTSDPDANPSDNQYEAFGLLVQPPGPDLIVRSTLAATAMTVGRPITFTVEAANAGNAAAAGTSLTLTLPDSVTLISATPAPSTSGAGHVTWDMGDLAAGASQQVTVTISLDTALAALASRDPDSEPAGVLTYTLRAGSVTPDFDLSNNEEQVVKPVEFAGPDLSVSLNGAGADGPGTLSAGQDVTYTLLYGNFGNQIAPTTTLTLSLWSGLSLVSAQPAPSRRDTNTTFAGGVLVWDLGDLPVGEWGTIQVRLHVASIPPEGSLVLAAIGSDTADIRSTNNVILDRRTAKMSQLYLPQVMRAAQR